MITLIENSYFKNVEILCLCFLFSIQIAIAEPNKIDFFEKNIRPILAQECYDCHSSRTKAKANLLLDSREGWLKGSDSGVVILPGNPKGSLLMQVIRHEHHELKMPEGGTKLDDHIIKKFSQWITDGAIDPRDEPSSLSEIAIDKNWESISKRRSNWWSFLPLKEVNVPKVDLNYSNHEIDQFLRQAQVDHNLIIGNEAKPEVVLRRLHYVLTGLPATLVELDEFILDWKERGSQNAVNKKVRELLDSPHFGERWAAHWMDWFRYSEGHGGEFDPAIHNAYEYRDYLIRALNQNVPYNRMIQEHIAGDLLQTPRLDQTKSLNESIIGLAHYRFVEHGTAPVDALDELIKFTDNQIDVVTKATMGLTVSCARCHDHKFDAISQKDYFGLFGIFASSRPAQRNIANPEVINNKSKALKKLKEQLLKGLKIHWLTELQQKGLKSKFKNWENQRKNLIQKSKSTNKKKAKTLPSLTEFDLMYAWHNFKDEGMIEKEWMQYQLSLKEHSSKAQKHNQLITSKKIDFRKGLPKSWRHEEGSIRLISAGSLGYQVGEELKITSILPSGLFSTHESIQKNTSIFSEYFIVEKGQVAIKWAGLGGALFRLVPQNYPIHSRSIYDQFNFRDNGISSWSNFETDYWEENRGYFQVSTRRLSTADISSKLKNDQGSWFLLQEIRHLNSSDQTLMPEVSAVKQFMDTKLKVKSKIDLLKVYFNIFHRCLLRLNTPEFNDHDAFVLTTLLKEGFLKSKESNFDLSLQKICENIRDLEKQIYNLTKRHAPGVVESNGFDQPIYPRGNHKKIGEVVSRGFIKSLGGKEFNHLQGTGRLELSKAMMDQPHPIFSRVIVNRLWNIVYGQGIVKSMDNFGRTGNTPSHPELLDYLAQKIIDSNWDLKAMIQLMITSKSFRLDSQTINTALDPENNYLSYANLRRFDAEIIQDHMLSISGELNPQLYGKSLTYDEKLKKYIRRGVYIERTRIGKNDLMASFNVPVPSSTKGQREKSNTPNQSMTLLNSPYVAFLAHEWAKKYNADITPDRLSITFSNLISYAYTRSPLPHEIQQLLDFYHGLDLKSNTDALAQVAHLIFNSKEFIYLQ